MLPVEKLEVMLRHSVQSRLLSARKPAVQFSGGLDSAIIQVIANVEHLYCVTFPDDGVDNLSEARLADPNREIIPVTFTLEQMIEEILPNVARLTKGEGTWSQVCQWYMCRQIAQDGCDVALVGEGADELFSGYGRHRILWWLDQMMADPHLTEYQGIIAHMFGDRPSIIEKMLVRNMPPEEAWSLVREHMRNSGSLVANMAKMEELTTLPDLLRFARLMSGAHGLICAFPFMEPEIVAFADNLPAEAKINMFKNKAILRDVAQNLGVPSLIIHEQTKKGLFIPQSWAPKDSPKWDRKWFTSLMQKAWEKC